MDENDLSYGAGLFDGEGCFRINNGKKAKYGHASVSMTNTSYELLEFMTKFGGKIYPSRTPRKKTAWQWSMQTREGVLNFTKTILPYLREKDKIRRGKILLKFCAATATKELRLKLIKVFFNR
jgi:hypothetical protein